MKKYDVAILGAGTAGLSARREIAKKTDNYVVIDPGPLGTTCARVGCMPSKVLIEVANSFARRHQFEAMGILGANQLAIDTQKVMNHVRLLRDRFVKSVLQGISSWTATHHIAKKASFIDHNTLDLEGEKIQAKKIIIATGSKPVVPKPWQKYQNYFLDTDHFFELENLPKRVAVVGLGVIGIELGQALSRLGVEVVGIDLKKAIGGVTHPKLNDYVALTFQKEFPLFFDGVKIIGPNQDGLELEFAGQRKTFDRVFLTMGRRPNIDNLGLEKLGLEMDKRGLPVFSPNNFRLGQSSLYFVGDVNTHRPILHEAADQGRVAGYSSVHEEQTCFQSRTRLGIVFSDPNIASVGQNFQQLKDKDIDFETGQVSYEGQGRAIVKLKEKGLVFLFADRKSHKLLGAEIFAPNGEHLAHLLAWAIALEITVEEALKLPFYHPVLEEGIRTALRDLAEKLNPSCPNPSELIRCQDPPAGSFSL